jgi:hypothetical protein
LNIITSTDGNEGNTTVGNALVLTITGNSVEEIRENLQKVAREFGALGESDALPVAVEPEVEKKPRGRPKKETAPAANGNGHLHAEADETTDPFAVETPPASSKKATREELNAAIMKVQTTKGLPEARKILSQHGYKRVPEIKEQDFAKVIASCVSVLG